MRQFKPDEVWHPQCVILGSKVSDLPITDPYIQFELLDEGVNDNMRAKLCLAAAHATSAIRKMLACATQ